MAGTTLLEFADGALRLHLSRIATLELNAPERRNAMSAAMWAGLSEAAAAIADNDEVRVLLVRGAGGKAFCAGAHIGEFEALYATAQSARDYSAVIRAAQEDLRNLAQPTIAVIEGACVGRVRDRARLRPALFRRRCPLRHHAGAAGAGLQLCRHGAARRKSGRRVPRTSCFPAGCSTPRRRCASA